MKLATVNGDMRNNTVRTSGRRKFDRGGSLCEVTVRIVPAKGTVQLKNVVFLRFVNLEVLLLILLVVECRTTPAPVRFVALLVEVIVILRTLLEEEVVVRLEVDDDVDVAVLA
jgi:hypothetical protein